MTAPRLTMQSLKILAALKAGHVAGSDIARATKLTSGTLYPILIRFEAAGWIKSQWETEDHSSLGRPRRRLYSFTKSGTKHIAAAFREIGIA